MWRLQALAAEHKMPEIRAELFLDKFRMQEALIRELRLKLEQEVEIKEQQVSRLSKDIRWLQQTMNDLEVQENEPEQRVNTTIEGNRRRQRFYRQTQVSSLQESPSSAALERNMKKL